MGDWRKKLYVNVTQNESSICIVRSDSTNSYRPIVQAETCEIKPGKSVFGGESIFGWRTVIELNNINKPLGLRLPNNDTLRVLPSSVVFCDSYIAFFAEQCPTEARIQTVIHSNFYYGIFSFTPNLLSYKIESNSIFVRRVEGMRCLTRELEKIIIRFPFLIVAFKVRDGFILEVCNITTRSLLSQTKIDKATFGSVKNIFLKDDYFIIVTNDPSIVFCHKITVDLNANPPCQLRVLWKKSNKNSILTHWGEGSVSVCEEQKIVILSCSKTGRILVYDLQTGSKLGKHRLKGVKKILFGQGDRANTVIFIGHNKNSEGEVTGIQIRKKRIERIEEIVPKIIKYNEGEFIVDDNICRVVGVKEHYPTFDNIVQLQYWSKTEALVIGTKRVTFVMSLNENRQNRMMMKVKTFDPDDKAWTKTGYDKGDTPELLSVQMRDRGTRNGQCLCQKRI